MDERKITDLLERAFTLGLVRSRDELAREENRLQADAVRRGLGANGARGAVDRARAAANRQALQAVEQEVVALARDGVIPATDEGRGFVRRHFMRFAEKGGEWSRAASATAASADLELQRLALRATAPIAHVDPYADPARRDDLLPLLRRSVLDDDKEQAAARASVEQPCAALLADVDHFKQVNDTEGGHEVGDRVLVEIARRLRAVVGQKGLCYRAGGEELVVLAENFDIREATALAERIREAVNATPIEGRPRTLSIGVAVAPHHATTAKDLLKAADTAMYWAKETGRNRVCVAPDPKT